LSTSRVLVVYYSRTDTTRKVAEELQHDLNADIEEIIDKKNRGGSIGWLMAGRDAGNKTLTEILDLSRDPSNYDLVVIGSPVWNDTVSTPIRTYLTKYRGSLSKVAFFTTHDSEETNAIHDMEEILGIEPVAYVQLRRKQDVDSGNLHMRLKAFLEKINQSLNIPGNDTQREVE
jgi:flavodoxin